MCLKMRAAIPPGKATKVVGMALHRLGERQRIAEPVKDVGKADDLRIGSCGAHINKRRTFELVRLPVEHRAECRLALQRGAAVVSDIVVIGNSAATAEAGGGGVAGARVSLDLRSRDRQVCGRAVNDIDIRYSDPTKTLVLVE